MIPSVEERQIRHCPGIARIPESQPGRYVEIDFINSCIFFKYDICTLGIERDMGCKIPCKEHITENEFHLLFEEHEKLIEFAHRVARFQPEAVEIMRKEGFKFDNLEDRWQKLAFSFYSDLCEIENMHQQLFEEDDDD